MSRSGSKYTAPRDGNRVPFILAASTADGITPVVLEADPSTHALVVSSTGGTAGTQYAELSTTSPGTGNLSLGRFKSSAPTLTDGQLYALQLDVNGNLKVAGTFSSSPTADVSPATQAITTVDLVSATATGANSQSIITGTPTAGSAASFSFATKDSVAIQVTGSWTGTIQSEISFDGGTTWYIRGVHQSGTSYIAAAFTANFSGSMGSAGTTNVRMRAIATMTGTATVLIVESTNPNSVYIANSITLSDATIASVKATIKAASTAAVAADPAIVVTLSPNNIATTVNSELADVTSTITNATQTVPVVANGLTGYDNVLVSINGTYGTATAIFQGSDDGGTTWYGMDIAARTDTTVIESGFTSLTNVTRAWNINIQGFDSFRVNPSAVASGTVNVRISAESAPTNAGATIQLGNAIPSGTNSIGTMQPGNTPNTVPWLFTPNDGTNSQLFLADNVDNIAPSATANKPAVTNRNFVYGSSAAVWERQRRIENTMSTTGQGVAAAGMVAQFDDVSPTPITENQFGPARFSANRNLYFTIRDAAGNERGVNVTAGNALQVEANLNPTASGGWTPYFANAITTTVAPTAAAGKFGGYMLINLNSSPAYLQVFDTTGAVTLGTTPPTFVIPIPANATPANGVAANVELTNGIIIVNGIKCAATTTSNGATTVTTGLSGTLWVK